MSWRFGAKATPPPKPGPSARGLSWGLYRPRLVHGVLQTTHGITEEVTQIPRNIYGLTKAAAEDICQLFYRKHALPCLVLRTSRFFPEEDDDKAAREAYADDNLKMNEFLFRRVDLQDVVAAHLLALNRAPAIGFGRYIISATTPLMRDDLADLRADAVSVVRRRVPEYELEYERRGWKLLPTIDRVYVNDKARRDLGWQPRYDFRFLLECLRSGNDIRSPLARLVGSKGYHGHAFTEGPYPVE